MRFFSQRCRFVQRRTGFCQRKIGNKTEIVICSYDDHILVSVSVSVLRLMFDVTLMKLHTTLCFQVIATQIGAMGTILHASSHVPSKPLILSLGLNDHSSETLKEIEAAVIDNRLW
ncbi:unnamed protein product [Brassica napus]|uniref:(rape) hypothetical protein n=1 Tax=Brassica napus TaxID=3708 RepID=A0A817BCZ2_BRANA|nr:unnamed protein product [Brassica napus]